MDQSAMGVRMLGRLLGVAAIGILMAGWFLVLRPTIFGGPASYVVVAGTSMEPKLHSGDVVVLQAADDYRIGDVVAYRIPTGQPSAGAPIIHRIVGGDATSGFILKGDNKSAPDPWRPKAADIVGRSWIQLPGGGDWLVTLRRPVVLAAVAAGFAAFFFFLSGTGKPRRPAGASGDASPGEAA